MVGDDEREDDIAWGRRMGAGEGTGFGLIAAGTVMGMAWLGGRFGTQWGLGEGYYAAIFLAVGIAIVAGSLWRGREET